MSYFHCMPFRSFGLLLIGVAGLGQNENPQTAARRSKLYSDGEKVSLSLLLDRPIYLPLERMEITISVANKTPFPLEVPVPFANKSAALDLYSPHARWKGIFSDEFGPSSPYPRHEQLDIRRMQIPPTNLLAAGAELTQKFFSSGRFQGADTSLLTGGGAPLHPGSHRLVYTLTRSASVDFRVSDAVLEAVAYVKLNGTVQSPGWPDPRFPGKVPATMTTQRGAVVAALGGDSAHWIVVSGLTSIRPNLLHGQRTGEPISSNQKFLSSHVRVARSALPITSISGVAAPGDSITITWVDSGGKTGSVRVDKDRRVLPARN